MKEAYASGIRCGASLKQSVACDGASLTGCSRMDVSFAKKYHV